MTKTENIMMRKAILSVWLSVFFFVSAQAQPDVDTVRLEHVEVTAPIQPQGVLRGAGGQISLTRQGLLRGMRTLGESDAVNTLLMLPGITSGSDYASGLSVDGHSHWQTSYSIDGTQVFFPFHFGGIFSALNTPHYSAFRLDARGSDLSLPMTIGASLNALTPNTLADSVSGTANAGLLATSATVAVPVTRRTSIYLSGRLSYVDMICRAIADNTTRYDFSDFNVTLLHAISQRNMLKINAFANFDHVRYTDSDYAMLTSLRWSNALANALWTYSAEGMEATLRGAYTQMHNTLGVEMSAVDITMPSEIKRMSVSGDINMVAKAVKAGFSADFTSFLPQYAATTGDLSSAPKHRLYTRMAEAHIAKEWCLTPAITLEAAMRVSAMRSDSRTYGAIDPAVALKWRSGAHDLTVSVSERTQYVQDVGFGDISVSTDFRLPPLEHLRPLRACGVSVNYSEAKLTDWLGVDLGAFAKRIRHEASYRGNLLDILADNYSPLKYIDEADGYNVGCSANLRGAYGALNGWAGYSLAVCRRHYAEFPDLWLPSASSPLHTFKAYAAYAITDRWRAMANFVLSSGRYYTPVTAMYIVAGNVLVEYGERNSARLPAYHRLDLSVDYTFAPFRIGKRDINSSLNFTIINAYGQRNVEMQNFAYNADANTLVQHRFTTLYRFLPSVSYMLSF